MSEVYHSIKKPDDREIVLFNEDKYITLFFR